MKEHIFVKRIQNEAYNHQKDGLTVDDLLVHVDFAKNYRNDQQNKIQSAYFQSAIRAFLFLLYAAIINLTEISCSKKVSSS